MSKKGKILQSNGVSELFAYDFGTVIAGSPVPVKFGFWNDKPRTVSPIVRFVDQGSDLEDFMQVAPDIVTLSVPYNLTVEQIDSPSYLDIGVTYYYVVEAYNCNGRTGKSFEVSIVLESGKTPKLSWSQVLGADGYYIYRSTVSGEYTNTLITVVTRGVTTFIDTGTPAGNGTPATENTTAGPGPTYGTPPTTFYSALSLGAVAPGQQKFFWVRCYAPLTVSEEGNPRACLMRLSE